jgi:cobalt-zinc-cadmium efflux system protein
MARRSSPSSATTPPDAAGMTTRHQAAERRALVSALTLTGLLCGVELVGGWWTNSLALASDAVHMLTDMGALALALFASWIAGREASDSKTFGWYRAEILAALVNGVVLCVVVLFIGAAAWRRLLEPPEVAGGALVLVAAAGLVVNVVVARRLREHEHHSLGIRGAYLHVLSDMFGSIGAVAAGIVIFLTGWTPADALASTAISALVLVRAFGLVREAVDVLMEAVPPHIDVESLRRGLERVPGTCEVHDLHVWTLTTGRYALSAHAVVSGVERDDTVLDAMAELCAREFRIDHVTIQLEHESPCATEPMH